MIMGTTPLRNHCAECINVLWLALAGTTPLLVTMRAFIFWTCTAGTAGPVPLAPVSKGLRAAAAGAQLF
tara:strand:- start:2956 stop:3162 length:207 start_codon:yes stop_codon:yes gene_type:complete